MTSEKALGIRNVLTEMGVTMTSEFVPFSRSRNQNNKDLSINWKVTVKRGSRSLTTDYMQGIGHLPESIQPTYWGKKKYYENELIKFACETGKVGYWSDLHEKVLPNIKPTPLQPPTIDEVLYCLVMDADTINYESFTDWAHDYGYNDDSIKDKKVYDDCMHLALQMRQLFNDADMNTLKDLFQDY